MNDPRFIELLNLYLDHQLAPDEAAELETEVLRNPSRRRTYDQYCRLQRGCCLLGERERSVAPESQAFARSLRDAERKIAAQPGRSSRRPIYAGLFAVTAMAACVTMVILANRPSSSNPQAPAANMVAKVNLRDQDEPIEIASLTPAKSIEKSTPSAVNSFEIQPVLTASVFGVARNAREAEIASNDPEALEWMKRVDQLALERLAVDEQAFESKATLHQDNRVFRSRQGMQGNAEFTAFQFQR